MQNRSAPAWRLAWLAAVALVAFPAAAGVNIATSDPKALAGIALGKGSEKPEAKNPQASKPSAKKPDAKAAATKPAATKGSKSAKAVPRKGARKDVARKDPDAGKPGPLADFGKVDAPADVVHVANWVSYTRNSGKRAFVLIDKKEAQLYVFDRGGKLKSRTPILLGKAVGDHTVPGVGNKPMSQVKEDEKTTPAGRFLARPGKNTSGEDIIWIDYDASVSMHRMRKVSAEERRAERMATPEADDNRISYGCVNVPAKFYDGILKPTVMKQGAFVYVLPETKTPQQQFGSVDVPAAKS
jgi:lipoprotein-anchoring transpeptidase ErfK/SrfK